MIDLYELVTILTHAPVAKAADRWLQGPGYPSDTVNDPESWYTEFQPYRSSVKLICAGMPAARKAAILAEIKRLNANGFWLESVDTNPINQLATEWFS